MHSCARNHTMACKTIVCNATDFGAVKKKKVRLHGETGPVDKLCIQELSNTVGALQSTVGGLCGEKKVREEQDKMLGESYGGVQRTHAKKA